MSDIYYDIEVERRISEADPRAELCSERQMAGLQSMINGWTIEIQELQLKIEQVQKELNNIKMMYR